MSDSPDTPTLAEQPAGSVSPETPTPKGPRRAITYAAISLIWIAFAAWPLITGSQTFILRDVFNTHLVLRHGPLADGTTISEGAEETPSAVAQFPPALIDPARGGGQPLAGNPNALPFYPTSLLVQFTPTLWALNAHFWIHWLLAPFAMFWMARRFGLSPPGAWAAAVAYGSSGFLVSTLNLYNVITVAALAPAFIAAALASVQEERPGWRLGVFGLLWALLLTAGDPASALLVLLTAIGAMMLCGRDSKHHDRRRGLLPRMIRLLRPALAIGLGSLVALPQIVELARILPTSFRGFVGYAGRSVMAGSLNPVQWIEWWLPGIFGRIDHLGEERFWPLSLFDGALPIFFSVSPGLIVLALVLTTQRAVSGPMRRLWLWSWLAIGIGAFFALGGVNPFATLLLELPGAGLFRYPSKFWLLTALAIPVMAGLGFDRLARSGSDIGTDSNESSVSPPESKAATRRFAIALASLAGFTVLLGLIGWAFPERLVSWFGAPEGVERIFVARWTESALTSLGLLLAAGLMTFLLRSRPRFRRLILTLLLFLHTATQLVFLTSLRTTDSTAAYRSSPSLAAMIEPGDRVAQADLFGLARSDDLTGLPSPDLFYLARRGHSRLDPFVGLGEGFHYDLQISPEGLDSFLGRVARDVVRQSETDAERLRLLRLWGFDWALLDRPLTAEAGQAEERARGREATLFEVVDPLPEVYWVDRVVSETDIGAAVRRLRDPSFDPKESVLLAGEPILPWLTREPNQTPMAAPARNPENQAPARWRILKDGPESLAVEIEAPTSGVLVVQRAWLSLWRATVDEEPVAIEAANLYRMGVQVPAGRHTVEMWVERGPYRKSLGLSVLGLVGLVLSSGLFGTRLLGRDVRRAKTVEVETASEDA